jgi:site-specific recombinase XerD
MDEALNEAKTIMEWYKKETIGFCRKEGDRYVQVGERARKWLEKYFPMDKESLPESESKPSNK